MARPTTATATATRKVTGVATGGSGSTRPASEIVTGTLAAHLDLTAAELAQLAGLGTSTVGKALAALETAGRASRHTPEVTGIRGRRPAARWRPVPVAAPADAEPLPAPPRRPTTKAPTETRTTAAQPTGGRSALEAAAGTAARASVPRDGSAPARTGRLGKGQLGTLVLEYLLAHPDTDLGPTAIGKALTRSQGAVANCLSKLAQAGDIVQASDKPRRYRLAS